MNPFITVLVLVFAHGVLPLFVGGRVLHHFLLPSLPVGLRFCFSIALGWIAYATLFSIFLLALGSAQRAFIPCEAVVAGAALYSCALTRRKEPTSKTQTLTTRTSTHSGDANQATNASHEVKGETAFLRQALRKSSSTRHGDVGIVLALILMMAAFNALYWVSFNPHGAGDAHAIWNLHARFLFRGGDFWQHGFTETLAWSHPDYPWQIPASTVRLWLWLGTENTVAPAFVSTSFWVMGVALFWCALSFLRNAFMAGVGVCVVLSAPKWPQLAFNQTGDLPLSVFFLLAAVLLALWQHFSPHTIHDNQFQSPQCFQCEPHSSRGLLLILGVITGGAAWTKNEGRLFLLAIAVVVAFHLIKRVDGTSAKKLASRRDGLWYVAGLLPFFVAAALLRHAVPVQNDLLSDSATMASRLLSGERIEIVAQAFVAQAQSFGGWFFPFWLVLLFFTAVTGFTFSRNARRSGGTLFFVLCAMLCGYFIIYLITPHPLQKHLDTSLGRLFLQLWPMAVFGLMMVLRAPDESKTFVPAERPDDETIDP